MLQEATSRLAKAEADMGRLISASEKERSRLQDEVERLRRKLDTLVGNGLADNTPVLRVWGDSTGSNRDDVVPPPLLRTVLQNVLPPVSPPAPSPILPLPSSLGAADEERKMVVFAKTGDGQDTAEVNTCFLAEIGVVISGPYRVFYGGIPPLVASDADVCELVRYTVVPTMPVECRRRSFVLFLERRGRTRCACVQCACVPRATITVYRCCSSLVEIECPVSSKVRLPSLT